MEYMRAGYSDFSSIIDSSGTYYHLVGDYRFVDQTELNFFPVNRSYSPHEADDPHEKVRTHYVKNRVYHNEVDQARETLGQETKLNILGNNLLFLAGERFSGTEIYSPFIDLNTIICPQAKAVMEQVTHGLSARGLKVELGVFGSRQVGLNGPDSDIDLICWVARKDRQNAADVLHAVFNELGYLNPNSTRRVEEYAARIAVLGGLPVAIGDYLAKQRLRWISPTGVKVSVQCLHKDYDHQLTKNIIDRVLNHDYEVVSRNSQVEAEVLGTSDPYNFPRRLDVVAEGETAQVIGMYWVHQGMGVGENANGVCAKTSRFTINATELISSSGSRIYALTKPGDFVAPSDVVSRID